MSSCSLSMLERHSPGSTSGTDSSCRRRRGFRSRMVYWSSGHLWRANQRQLRVTMRHMQDAIRVRARVYYEGCNDSRAKTTSFVEASCEGDFNGDGVLNILDVLDLVAAPYTKSRRRTLTTTRRSISSGFGFSSYYSRLLILAQHTERWFSRHPEMPGKRSSVPRDNSCAELNVVPHLKQATVCC